MSLEKTLLALIQNFKIIEIISSVTIPVLIQNIQNYEGLFLKVTFSITFQQFRKCLLNRHFLKIQKIESVS